MIYPIKQVPVFNKQGDLNVTCPFGWRIHPVTHAKQFHNGVDCTRWTGGSDVSGIVAIQDGEVVAVETGVKGYSDTQISGNYVRIKHGGGYVSSYCHLAYGSMPSTIKVGVMIKKGTFLGEMGESGRATGIHLHFGLQKNDEWIDPLNYLLEKEFIPPMDGKMCTPEVRQIKKGDINKTVRCLQVLLNDKGFKGADGKKLDVDGEFGLQTMYAVESFQGKYNLTVDGIVGKDTWSKLLWY